MRSTDQSDAGARHGLAAGFLMACARFPLRPALDVQGMVLTYEQLRVRAMAFSRAIAASGSGSAFVGVHTGRSITTYSGILGALLSGRAVVPLNATFPAARLRLMIDDAGLHTIVIDRAAVDKIDELLRSLDRPLTVLMSGAADTAALRQRWQNHTFVDVDASAAENLFVSESIDPNAFAYLFFTSGSTGKPKGVGVLQRNTVAFVRMSVERYRDIGLDEHDRFSQFYELSFDSSMFDLYVCWAFGACLCCPSPEEWINPNKYIEDKALTVVDMVPSMGHAMNRRGGWRPGRFPKLKLCRFGGEALSADLCAALAAAAPNAVVENVYGPTECTVDACYYRWDRPASMEQCEHGMVPIGYPGSRVGVRIVDEALEDVHAGGEGELLISGPQVTPGYWGNPEKTRDAFIRLRDSDTVHYRTGDLVRSPRADQPIVFLGRFDHQIKIAGVRIELGEVELALRKAAGTDMAVALGWPITTSGASGIVAFVANAKATPNAIQETLKRDLPNVMVPRDIRLLDALPINPNGKVDRRALLELLQRSSTVAESGD